jgi:large subunit ribosomal protein L6
MSGTLRQLVNNMVVGVTEGFEKKLSWLVWVTRLQHQGSKLNLAVGFSHPVNFRNACWHYGCYPYAH